MKIGKVDLGESLSDKRARRLTESRPAKPAAPRKLLSINPYLIPSGVPLTDDLAPPVKKEDLTPEFQQELLDKHIRLRQLVDLVVDLDWNREIIDVRPSVIEGIDEQDGHMLLVQTSPPLLKSDIGREVELTFLSTLGGRFKDDWWRVGSRVTIRDVMPDYILAPDYVDTVVKVDRPTQLRVSSARLAHRIAPTPEMELTLYCLQKSERNRPLQRVLVNLLDISLGGMRFSHSTSLDLPHNSLVYLILVSGRHELNFTAQVVRTGYLKNMFTMITGVKLLDMDPQTGHDLQQLIAEMSRHSRSLRSGLSIIKK